jgi:hypothetical protein
MSFSTREVSCGYFKLTKKIAKLEQIIFKILRNWNSMFLILKLR